MSEKKTTQLSELKLTLSTNVDEDALNKYIDDLVQMCEDKWNDVSVDYNSFEDYVLDEFDVDYLLKSGIIKIETEFLKVSADGK
ncbi:TPA: hypothetical protein PNO69_004491 [Salmonella enterica]|nr:hypothetical protein [Salmonella enterica]HCH9607934.1 hypothetical protein [Salmonella enterica]HDI5000228.1 hypothetical protein [Salmonella enterica]HDI5005049.1 hypothetical protein [Salmonella enterica]